MWSPKILSCWPHVHWGKTHRKSSQYSLVGITLSRVIFKKSAKREIAPHGKKAAKEVCFWRNFAFPLDFFRDCGESACRQVPFLRHKLRQKMRLKTSPTLRKKASAYSFINDEVSEASCSICESGRRSTSHLLAGARAYKPQSYCIPPP